MTTATTPRTQPRGFAILLIISGIVGWLSSLELVVSKIQSLEFPEVGLSCDFSLVVNCSNQLGSWQGAVFFGISNPIFGLGAFIAPLVLGFAILSGAKFARWFWILFWIGTLGGFIWVLWFQYQSIYVLGTLCIYCMTMWLAMIPLFWATTLHVLRTGLLPAGPAVKRFAKKAWGYLWVIVIVNYLIVAVLAQLQLNVLFYLAPGLFA